MNWTNIMLIVLILLAIATIIVSVRKDNKPCPCKDNQQPGNDTAAQLAYQFAASGPIR